MCGNIAAEKASLIFKKEEKKRKKKSLNGFKVKQKKYPRPHEKNVDYAIWLTAAVMQFSNSSS